MTTTTPDHDIADTSPLVEQPTDGSSLRPPEVPLFFYWVARLFLRVIGWQVAGQMPNVDRCVVVAAPHTSNFDGLLLLATMAVFRVRGRFVIKAEWVRSPIGWLLRWFGAVGLDRSKSRNFVEQTVHAMQQQQRFVLIIAPEGTRRRTEYWRSGFYWIAEEAGVPLLLGFVDFRHKRCGIGPLLHPSGDLLADMEIIRAFYSQMTPHHPAKMGPMRVRPYNVKTREESQ